MSAIPDDIMRLAKTAVAGIKCFPPSDLDAVTLSVAHIILSERQRTSVLIEEVKAVLGPFAKAFDELREWSDLGEMNTYDDLAAARALLSKLGEQ